MSVIAPQPFDDAAESAQRFDWPTPPFAAYPRVQVTQGPLPCDIEGQGGEHNRVQLLNFDLPLEEVLVQVSGVKRPIRLRFNQLRLLSLEEPIRPEETSGSDPHAALLAHRPESSYAVQMSTGEPLQGQTVGHVEVKQGLFLFPPLSPDGVTRRLFIPAPSYQSFTVGARVGEILVDQTLVTEGQVEQVMQAQTALRQQRLGEMLVSRQIITPEQLLEAIDMQRSLPVMRLGEALIALDLVSPHDLEEALRLQTEGKGLPLGELLVRKGLVSRDNLRTALAHKLGYPLVDVMNFPLDVEALKVVPYSVASRLQVLPLLLRQGRLIVAMDDPTRRNVISELEFLTQYLVVPALPKVGTLMDGLKQAYEKHGLATEDTPANLGESQQLLTSNALLQTLEQSVSSEEPEQAMPLKYADKSLEHLINSIIIDAAQQGVSDIHIECPVGGEKVRVRFRVEGHLHLHLELPPTFRVAVVGRIKFMADLDPNPSHLAQHGKITFNRFAPQFRLDLRVTTIPTAQGLEDVVLRLLTPSRALPLEGLGLSQQHYATLRETIQRPYGMVLCVGPTGAGKTTTLHALLGHINRSDIKIWTAENPIEITQPGLRQVQVNPSLDWTYPKALHAIMQADPDVILLGHLHETETARMALEVALLGRRVLSSMHSKNAPEALVHLLDMGLDPFNLADGVQVVLAQRLARRLCTQCRSITPATTEQVDEWLADHVHAVPEALCPDLSLVRAQWVQRFGSEGRLQRYHSTGCKACDGTGHKGRIGFHELLRVSPTIRRLVQQRADVQTLHEQGLREGMRTLRQDGLEKMLQGITSFEEVRTVTPH